jgi:hypothetical protein
MDRQSDVWVEDRATHRVKKVYEAARKDASKGEGTAWFVVGRDAAPSPPPWHRVSWHYRWRATSLQETPPVRPRKYNRDESPS